VKPGPRLDRDPVKRIIMESGSVSARQTDRPVKVLETRLLRIRNATGLRRARLRARESAAIESDLTPGTDFRTFCFVGTRTKVVAPVFCPGPG